MTTREFYSNQKSVAVNIAGFDGSINNFLWAAPVRCWITNIRLVSDTATTGSDVSNNYAFQIANLTKTLNLRSAAVTTNGNEISADAVYSLTPNQNGLVSANDVLELQITETGTATSLATAKIIAIIDYLPVTTG